MPFYRPLPCTSMLPPLVSFSLFANKQSIQTQAHPATLLIFIRSNRAVGSLRVPSVRSVALHRTFWRCSAGIRRPPWWMRCFRSDSNSWVRTTPPLVGCWTSTWSPPWRVDAIGTADSGCFPRWTTLPLAPHAYLAYHVASKYVATSARADAPSRHVFFRVGPKQIADSSLQRHFLHAVDRASLAVRPSSVGYRVESRDGRRKTAVDTENTIVDQGAQVQTIEDVHALLPHVHSTVLAHTFVVKTVHLRYLTTFMIPTKKSHTVWITHL